MNKKTKLILSVISIFVVLAVSGVIAYFTDITTVINNATMGIVDIELKEYTIDENGNKIEWSDKTEIVPGEIISKIPEITCVEGSVDCYVRARIQITSKYEELQDTIEKVTVNVNKEDWYYCETDGYFYYKEILTDESEPIELFSEVKIPHELDNKWSLEEFLIGVTVEAIQARNFTTDFSENSTEPWPGITSSDIQECIYPDHIKYK